MIQTSILRKVVNILAFAIASELGSQLIYNPIYRPTFSPPLINYGALGLLFNLPETWSYFLYNGSDNTCSEEYLEDQKR